MQSQSEKLNESARTPAHEEKRSKKAYRSPQLSVFGNVLELTNNITNPSTVMDNPSQSKT